MGSGVMFAVMGALIRLVADAVDQLGIHTTELTVFYHLGFLASSFVAHSSLMSLSHKRPEVAGEGVVADSTKIVGCDVFQALLANSVAVIAESDGSWMLFTVLTLDDFVSQCFHSLPLGFECAKVFSVVVAPADPRLPVPLTLDDANLPTPTDNVGQMLSVIDHCFHRAFL